jgi:hypothetical protein
MSLQPGDAVTHVVIIVPEYPGIYKEGELKFQEINVAVLRGCDFVLYFVYLDFDLVVLADPNLVAVDVLLEHH